MAAEPQTDESGRRETDEEALIRRLLEREVSVPEAEEDTCRRYYQHNRNRFRSRDIYEASHILSAARRAEPVAFGAARVRAGRLVALLKEDPARFAELAAAYSVCPSASSGGSLGQLTKGDTTPEFEQALLRLAPGETTAAPVETRYGFHIIRLDRVIRGRQLPFALVRERIAEYLTERAHRTALAQYLARLAARARITGIDLPSATDLRVH